MGTGLTSLTCNHSGVARAQLTREQVWTVERGELLNGGISDVLLATQVTLASCKPWLLSFLQ